MPNLRRMFKPDLRDLAVKLGETVKPDILKGELIMLIERSASYEVELVKRIIEEIMTSKKEKEAECLRIEAKEEALRLQAIEETKNLRLQSIERLQREREFELEKLRSMSKKVPKDPRSRLANIVIYHWEEDLKWERDPQKRRALINDIAKIRETVESMEGNREEPENLVLGDSTNNYLNPSVKLNELVEEKLKRDIEILENRCKETHLNLKSPIEENNLSWDNSENECEKNILENEGIKTDEFCPENYRQDNIKELEIVDVIEIPKSEKDIQNLETFCGKETPIKLISTIEKINLNGKDKQIESDRFGLEICHQDKLKEIVNLIEKPKFDKADELTSSKTEKRDRFPETGFEIDNFTSKLSTADCKNKDNTLNSKPMAIAAFKTCSEPQTCVLAENKNLDRETDVPIEDPSPLYVEELKMGSPKCLVEISVEIGDGLQEMGTEKRERVCLRGKQSDAPDFPLSDPQTETIDVYLCGPGNTKQMQIIHFSEKVEMEPNFSACLSRDCSVVKGFLILKGKNFSGLGKVTPNCFKSDNRPQAVTDVGVSDVNQGDGLNWVLLEEGGRTWKVVRIGVIESHVNNGWLRVEKGIG